MTSNQRILATQDSTLGGDARRVDPGAPAATSPAPSGMFAMFGVAARATLVTLVVTGLVYPLAVTLLAQVIFPGRAAGSLVVDEHQRVVGSSLIAQGFTNPAYFQPRPSAAGSGYDPLSSGGTNLGPTSKKLRETTAALIVSLRAQNPDAVGDVPAELATSSGSGLDPHLSPEAAQWQVPRIAKARQVNAARVSAVIDELAEGRDLGIFGEPRVNVLLVNLALDQHFGQPAPVAVAPSSATAPSPAPAPPATTPAATGSTP